MERVRWGWVTNYILHSFDVAVISDVFERILWVQYIHKVIARVVLVYA